jgi:hypothetical protein
MSAQVLWVLLAAIDRADGWDSDLDMARVAEMSADISERRQTITPIGVKALGDGRYRLSYGRHRLKAHEQAGAQEILCLVLEHESADEERAQVLAEALHRCTYAGQERRKLLAEYVQVTARLPERAIIGHAGHKLPTALQEAKRGRPASPELAAKKEAAAGIGVSQRTRRRAEQEAKAPPKLSAPEAESEPTAEPEAHAPVEIPPALDWFDLEPDPDVDGQARKIQAQVAEMDKGLRALRKLITGARELGLPNALAQQVEADYDKLAHGIRRLKPKCACHYCKGGDRTHCYACSGVGWATVAQAEGDIPAQLRTRGKDAMVANGRGGYRPAVSKARALKVEGVDVSHGPEEAF